MANMAAIAERLASDPTYAEKLRASRQPDVNKGQWADYAADNWVRPDEHEDGNNAAAQDDVPDHERMDQCRVVAQALAFRSAEPSDAVELHRLINRGYGGEQAGPDCPEGFRILPLIDLDTVQAMVSDPDCHWLLAEAPNGRGTVADGALLGCACFSVGTAAASASTGEDSTNSPSSPSSSSTATPPSVARPDRVAAIRLLTALPAFHGLLIGRRLLTRVEKAIASGSTAIDGEQQPVDRILCCVPAMRKSIISWAIRRGYSAIQTAAFPVDMATSFAHPTELSVLEKKKCGQATKEGTIDVSNCTQESPRSDEKALEVD